MLRIHFSDRDLANTTIDEQPSPMWELLLSLHALQHRGGELVLGRWRRTASATPREELGLLLELAPKTGYSPDFLTPESGGAELGSATDEILRTPVTTLRAELSYLAMRRGRSTPWIADLASGARDARRRLGRSIEVYYERTLGPFWDSIHNAITADRASRVHRLATGGIDAMLATLHPGLIWTPPVLSVLDFVDADLHLDGRGLHLIPSFFCWQAPTKLRDPDRRPVLVYPIDPAPGVLCRNDQPAGARPRDSLAALLGGTRARALEAAASGVTTTDLARRCGVSIAAASQQAGVLRRAGLIVSRRIGGAVLHEITRLGVDLLHGA